MSYSFKFSTQFAVEYARFPKDQQDKVDDFTDTFLNFGLGDFSKYPGKITYSWRGLDPSSAEFGYANSNELWHYHVGIPTYRQAPDVPYKTSDWVLHFQWPGKGSSITVVDLYSHYKWSGEFYLPPATALK